MSSLPQNDSKKKGVIAWMTAHPVTANLIMLVLLVGGFFSGYLIKKEVFPYFELDLVQITVPYPGASPQEVEKGIILAIEEAVQGLEGVNEVRASAREGVGTVTVEMIEGENLQKLGQDIQSEVDRITSFPEEAEKPRVVIVSRKRYVVSLALYGDQSERVLREYAEYLRDRLLQDPDITQVELVGVRNYEISVEIPQNTLRAYNLTLEEVAQRIARTSVELPGGAVKTSGGDILVRVKERKDYGHEFGQIPIITSTDGTQVLLEDIADIKDGFEETDNAATFNGEPAVMIEVYRIGDQTPVSVSDAVKRTVTAVNQELPPGLTVVPRNDRSEIYRQRMGLLVRNGCVGLGLVFLLLALFLEIRLAFWVALGIPISFLGSLLFLPTMDVSINMISMFAFIVTLGIVVDDAIVVGENIYYHHQRGVPWFNAAISGTREIAMPVTFSVLTNMIAFVPMFFVSGIMGKVFKQIPVVVISVFAISLVECFWILPAHVGHQKHPHHGELPTGGEPVQARAISSDGDSAPVGHAVNTFDQAKGPQGKQGQYGQAEFQHRVNSDGPTRPLPPAAEQPAAQSQPSEEHGQHGTERPGGGSEDKRSPADPGHFVYQPGEAGQEETTDGESVFHGDYNST